MFYNFTFFCSGYMDSFLFDFSLLSSADLFCILPDFFYFICTFFLLIFSLFCGSSFYFQELFIKNVFYCSIWSVILTIFLLKEQFNMSEVCFFNDLLKINELVIIGKLFLLFFLFVFFFINFSSIVNDRVNSFEFCLLVLYAVLGMFFLLSSNDLIGVYLALELQGLCFFVLAAFKRFNEFSLEAGLKYFFLGAFASCFLLLGMVFIYVSVGATNLDDLSLLFVNSFFFDNSLLLLGFLFFSLGLFFKLGVVPFHSWLPDTYEGSLIAVTCLFSILPKITLTFFFFNIYLKVFFGFSSVWFFFFGLCAFFSFFLGTFGTFGQLKIKRFLAYGSISQVGFILFCFCTLTRQGVFSLIIFIFFYCLMTLGFFVIMFSVRDFFLGHRFQYIRDFRFLIFYNPFLALGFSILLFSFAGIPPFAGFYSKMFVLFSGINSGLIFFSVIILLLNIVGCFYYIRFIKTSVFESTQQLVEAKDAFSLISNFRGGWFSLLPVNRECSLVLAFILFFVIFAGFFSSSIYFIFSFLSHLILSF